MSDNECYESADEEIQDKAHPDVSPIKSLPETNETQSNSSWRSWSAFNAISTVSKGLASATAHVVDNVSKSLVSMNIPDPEEMARIHKEESNKIKQESPTNENKELEGREQEDGNSVYKIFSNVTKISSKVVTGGLDTLEEIGKKTINIIQETDPNLKDRIRNIGGSKNESNLSDLLKEAKEKNEEFQTDVGSVNEPTKTFETLMDEYKGLMHLEGLEVLSKQSKLKIEMLMTPLAGKALTEIKETLKEVEELCELPDCEDQNESFSPENFLEKLNKAKEDINVSISFHEIVNFTMEANGEVEEMNGDDGDSLIKKALEILAKLCALSLHNFCKLAENLLILNHRSTADEIDAVIQLTSLYFSLFNFFAMKFNDKLKSSNITDNNKIATSATTLFLECSNANSYIKKGFSYFIPILQLGAV